MQKVAVITGASRGIGAATALRLASDGFDICVNYVSSHTAALEIVKQVKLLGVRAICVQADTSSEHEVIELFNRVDTELGSTTALINNAAVLFKQARLEQMSAERINQLLAINVT